jgi:uncharacterized cupredoxin-like copper-binding protein
MKKIWMVTLGAAAVLVALMFVLPAGARSSRAAAGIAVTAGKPSEFSFKLSRKTVPHGTVTFTITNGGALPHDFSINKKKTALITPGSSKTLTVTFTKAGNYGYMCTVSGHAAAGMKGTLKVT